MSTHQLVLDHMSLAATIAGKISKRLPRHLDMQDIHQEARLGLLHAAAKYDSGKNVPFGAYARRRISGAVVDSLRRADHLSRQARARLKSDMLDDHTAPLPLLEPDLIPYTGAGPDACAAAAELQVLVRGAIDTLPPRLRTILLAYYHHGKTMREIGLVLGVNESRISQLHARALRMLHVYFQIRGMHQETRVA